MSTISLNNFTGINPRTSDTGLAVNAATEAHNVKLQSGELRPWKKPTFAYQVIQSDVKTIFKLDSDESADSAWCEWVDDTDVCYGPIADSGEGRIYYSENGVCKKTNIALAISGTSGAYPRDWYYMGVPYPTSAPTLNTTIPSGTDPDELEQRAYVYTYVSNFGAVEEESAPSDAAKITCLITGGTVDVSAMLDPPTDHYNINAIRIYRSVTGSSTMVYMLVDEVALTSHTLPTGYVYHDTKDIEQLSMELPSLYYTPPPSGLKGLVSMPNGFLAGFVGNQVWFSEPYLPHAWPSTYMLTVDSSIVGLGVYGQTLVVATTRQPYTITGTHPGAMTQEKQPMTQPCVSKRSIAYDQYGVIYASAYGLVGLAAGQMDVFTRPVVTADEWREYIPTTMIGAMYNNMYLCAYSQADFKSVLVVTRGDEPPLVNYDLKVAAFHVERGTGRVYYLNKDDNKIYELDSDPTSNESFIWKSKRFVYPYKTGFTAMKLDADYHSFEEYSEYLAEYLKTAAENAVIFADDEYSAGFINGSIFGGPLQHGWEYGEPDEYVNYAINGSPLTELPTPPDVRSLTLTLFADEEAIWSKQFSSIVAVRVPPEKGYAWQVQITGNVPVRSFAISTSMKELAPPI